MILNGEGPRKYCSDCRQDLPVANFTRNARNRDGLSFYCGRCARARLLASRRKRLEPPRTRSGQGPRDLAEGMKWCPQCDTVKPATDFPSKGGLCAICREAPAAQVDHDHKTNRVRGLLCFNGNGALGQFRDREDLMLRAVLYLGRKVGDSLNYPDLHAGLHVGDYSNIRPEGEPRVA